MRLDSSPVQNLRDLLCTSVPPNCNEPSSAILNWSKIGLFVWVMQYYLSACALLCILMLDTRNNVWAINFHTRLSDAKIGALAPIA